MRLTRYTMYKRISETIPPTHRIKGRVLSISELGDLSFVVDLDASEVIETRYPAVDMQALPFADASFDAVISDQVIEHLENPIRAVDESFRVLKPGGLAIHTTCFINYHHPSPKDYWRFSPDALRFLCRDFSDVLQCEGWGNRLAFLWCFLGDRFRAMEIPRNRWSIRNGLATWNEGRYAISTWIIPRK